MPIEPVRLDFLSGMMVQGAPLSGVCIRTSAGVPRLFPQSSVSGVLWSSLICFEQDHLDFLRDATSATQLWFWDIALTDIEGLYSLPQLKFLGVNPRRPGIDFTGSGPWRLSSTTGSPADDGLERSPVSTYHLWHYKPRTKSFEGLPIPGNVERLQFYWANPASLAGLPVLTGLKHLEFNRCRNLSDVSLVPNDRSGPTVSAATTCTRLNESA